MTLRLVARAPSGSNAEIAASIMKVCSHACREGKRRYTREQGHAAVAAYVSEHGLSERRTKSLVEAFDALGFVAYPNSAQWKMLGDHVQAERRKTLTDMRAAGKTSTPEFDALYAEEAAWLAANDIAYYPPLGWHFTR